MTARNFVMYIFTKYPNVPKGGVGRQVPYSSQSLAPYGAHSGSPSPPMKNPAYAPVIIKTRAISSCDWSPARKAGVLKTMKTFKKIILYNSIEFRVLHDTCCSQNGRVEQSCNVEGIVELSCMVHSSCG